MLKGTVNFTAAIKGNGLAFPLLDFNPDKKDVDKVEIEGADGKEVSSTVHIASVATQEEGIVLAAEVNRGALDRISFDHCVVIENARMTRNQFSPVNPQPDVHAIGVGETLVITGAAEGVKAIHAADIKAELEQASPAGERYFGLFRSALQSESPVEQFMHLYSVLLMLHNDRQADIDAFIVAENPTVPQTQSPVRNPGVMETVYTRLRNEFGHTRTGVNLANTKAEMANRVGGMIAVTKRAIELRP